MEIHVQQKIMTFKYLSDISAKYQPLESTDSGLAVVPQMRPQGEYNMSPPLK
jgi:hypothetical protein